jgi:hypothetical protein
MKNGKTPTRRKGRHFGQGIARTIGLARIPADGPINILEEKPLSARYHGRAYVRSVQEVQDHRSRKKGRCQGTRKV